MDWIGAGLGVSGLILANVAWNQGPLIGWGEPYVPVLLISGIGCMVAFAWRERRVDFPLFPPGIMNAATTSIAICVGLGWAAFGIWMYYIYRFIEIINGTSAFTGALQFIPVVVSGVCAAIVTDMLLRRFDVNWLMVTALVAWLTGCLLAAIAASNETYWANFFVSMVVMSWGYDSTLHCPSAEVANY